MERRLSVHARSTRHQVVLAIMLASATATAAPKKRNAKAAFDRGVAAYSKKEYAAAAAELAKSYALEADVETLFAWAQAERQQEHCDKALELYDKLLANKLPEANKKVIREKRDECQAIIAAQTPTPPPPPEPRPDPAPEPEPESEPKLQPEPAPARVDPPEDKPLPVERPPEGRSRFGVVGLGLVGVGAVGLGVGGYFLVASRNAASDAKNAQNYFDVEPLNSKADSEGRKGMIASIAGGVVLVGGLLYIATRDTSPERTKVSGWVTPDGGGVVAAGRF